MQIALVRSLSTNDARTLDTPAAATCLVRPSGVILQALIKRFYGIFRVFTDSPEALALTVFDDALLLLPLASNVRQTERSRFHDHLIDPEL